MLGRSQCPAIVTSALLTTSAFILGAAENPLADPRPKMMLGVKIYETKREAADLFREWQELGLNTVVASASLNRDPAFREQAKRTGIARFVIVPVFYDPDALKADPDLFAVTAHGERAREEWVEFACPSREEFRRRKIEWIKSLVREADPDGLSIDFIRHFVFWEKVYPDRKPETIPSTCFDASCVRSFQKATGVKLPGDLRTPPQIAAYVTANHLGAWAKWKCDLIAGMIRDIAREARTIKPTLLINVHAVPWRRTDFGGGIRTIVGQDFSQIAPHVDYISPMTYAHMVKQPPAWVHAVVEDIADVARRPVIPSIQVGKAYLETPLSVEEFSQSLKEALAPPSGGVVFWAWQAFEEEPEKKAAVQRVLKGPKWSP